MFSCVVHNWNSHSAPCPMCFPDTYTSASGSEDDTVTINSNVDYWMGKYYKVDEQLTLAIDALQESQHEAEENYKKFMNMTASAATYKAAFDQQIIEIAQQDSDISALQSSLKEKENRIAELEKVLTGLVNLKELKDTEGKTEIYLQLQPIAWKQAKELLAK